MRFKQNTQFFFPGTWQADSTIYAKVERTKKRKFTLENG
jgi:hypothetical protein